MFVLRTRFTELSGGKQLRINTPESTLRFDTKTAEHTGFHVLRSTLSRVMEEATHDSRLLAAVGRVLIRESAGGNTRGRMSSAGSVDDCEEF